MLSTTEALSRILSLVQPLPAVRVPLDEALGRALAEDLVAPESVPPFTNSAMDGYALRAQDAAGASPESPVHFRVEAMLPAGQVSGVALEAGQALRIMTGAPIPDGADAVVPVEDTENGEGWMLLRRPLKPGANIRPLGEDVREGEALLGAGTTLRPAELGVLASLGFAEVPVRRRAVVAVLTTGDELVPVGEKPGPGQIRDSNLHALCAQLRALGAEVRPYPRITDLGDSVQDTVAEALAKADVLLTTGGISVGDRDPVKPALQALGATGHFWKVAQKPGGPFGFWTLGDKPIFGLPGNPVAAMVMLEEYVRPALRQMMGHRRRFRPELKGRLAEGWRKSVADGKLHFLRVVVAGESVRLAGPQGSGQLSSMMRANGLALMPESCTEVRPGDEVTVHLTELPEDH